MRRRWWYHLSARDHGPTMRADRRPPLLRADGEPVGPPRVCVSDSPAGCVSAVLLPPGPGYLYVYVGRTVAPVGVWDAAITGERWVVTPRAELRLWRALPADLLRDAYAATLLLLEHRRRPTPWRVRVAQFCVAARVLGTDTRWAARLRERWLGGEDPEEYILRQIGGGGAARRVYT